MITTKTPKTKASKIRGLQDDESKPAQLAKLIFPAIVRYIKAQRSATVEKSPKFLLDSGNATRICVCIEDNLSRSKQGDKNDYAERQNKQGLKQGNKQAKIR